MSRQIDLTDLSKLSVEDVQYLRDRGAPSIVNQLNELAKQKPAEVEPVMEEVDEPYDKWPVEELRDELNERKLNPNGKKQDLVARLQADDAKANN